MNTENPAGKVVFFEWEAPSRYFETKPPTYFKSVIALAALVSLFLFFIKEYLLMMVTWVAVFVVYAKALVPPPHIRYKITRFGIQFYDTTVHYKNIHSFSVAKKPAADVVRFIMYGGLEWSLVLPSLTHEKAEIVAFLQEKIPFVEHIPETEAEKIANWLKKAVGLG